VHHPISFGAQITGRIARYEWSYGDGTSPTLASSHVYTNLGDYTVTLTAFNTDNPTGVSASLLIHVLPPNQPLLQFATMTTNGFQFEFAGQYEVQFWVEVATNLAPPINWQALQTIFFSTGGVHRITDSAPTNEARFYRVRAR
jgi:PKD repeat protein